MGKRPLIALRLNDISRALRGVMLNGQINSLQAGRAFAALAVVVHHSTLAAASFGGPFAGQAIFELGYLGVDFFFVLSGYIIYHSSQGKALTTYAMSRVRRVYLPYLPVGIGIALLYSFVPVLSAVDRSWSWLPTLTLLPVQAETALSVAWTLKHEIFFYALFAVLYFSGRLAVGLVLWSIAIVAATITGVKLVPLALINLEFVFGILVAIAVGRGVGGRWWFLAAALTFVVWLALGAQRELSPLVGLAFAFAILPTVRLEHEGRFTVPTWLLLLGAASYAIYLTHGLAISVVARLIHSSPLIFAVATASSVTVGLAYYWLVETPLLKLPLGRPRPLAAPTPIVPVVIPQNVDHGR